MELIQGITKLDRTDYVLYYIDYISEEFKREIRSRLVAICHGADNAQSTSLIYSYKETVKEFLNRYNVDDTTGRRNKGLVGELLIHTIIDYEGRFIAASPFFNMEERSFKKGYDIALFEPNDRELWIAEVKSGEKQQKQKNSSSAIVGLINTAKTDLKERLNDKDTHLWLNALNAAKVAMVNNTSQRDAVLGLLEQCADREVAGQANSTDYNVILSASLFHPIAEKMGEKEVGRKLASVRRENLFNKIIIIAVQKSTYKAVYDFLKSEVDRTDEK